MRWLNYSSLIACMSVFQISDFSFCILMAEFGEKEVSILTEHYEPVLEAANVQIDELDTEWSMLKIEIYAQ